MSRYKELKARQRAKQKLAVHEDDYINRVEAIIGYEVELHLPIGSKFILGADDAEKIYKNLEHLVM